MINDKNGREIHAGDIVEISGAYFKNDNGYWFVEQDTTNKAYNDTKNLVLIKIGKRGKISSGKYNLAFYPLKSYVSDWKKSLEADKWNRENATIEIIDTIDNSAVIERFEQEKAEYEENIRWHELHGYSESFIQPTKDHLEYIDRTLARLYSRKQ